MAGESELTSRLKRRGSPATLRMPRSSVLEKARAESCRGSAIVSIAIVSTAIVSVAIVSIVRRELSLTDDEHK